MARKIYGLVAPGEENVSDVPLLFEEKSSRRDAPLKKSLLSR